MALKIIFYILSVITLAAGFMVITSKNPVKAALSLVLAFVAAAGIWLTLQVEFLALTLIVVYVGAVMVLFLFVVMMLDVKVAEYKSQFVKYWPIAALIGMLMVVLLIWTLGPTHFGLNNLAMPVAKSATYSNISEVGQAMFTRFVYPFEIAGALLLSAMIASISLTFRGKRPNSKTQVPGKQIKVKAQDRLKVIKMDSEKKVKGGKK